MITKAIAIMKNASIIGDHPSEYIPQIPARIAVTPIITHMSYLTSCLNDSMIELGGGSGLTFSPYTAFLRSRSALSPTIPVLLSELIPVRMPSAHPRRDKCSIL